MKKILVFGATGNIGKYFIKYILENNIYKEYQIIALGRKKLEINSKILYLTVDITKKEDFLKIPTNNIYAIVNLTGVLPAYLSSFNPYQYIDTNIIGSINILEFARKNKVDRVLYTQTWSDLAGYWGKETVLRPYMPRKLKYHGDHAFYSITKSMIVDSMNFYHEEYGIKSFIFRLPNIYMYDKEMYYYVNGAKKIIAYRYMIEQAINGEDIELWGDPGAFKDIVYVKDLCKMLYLAIKVDKSGGIYNVGTGVKTTLLEQIQGIIEVFSPTDKKSNIIYQPNKESFDSFVMDISNARHELGYEPDYLYIDYLKDYKKERYNNKK